ncbi:MAG: PIN domain-containing protein [Anaerolineae bacterium]|nr:PIN domain-containing protein [Anaerolineae bacterium]
MANSPNKLRVMLDANVLFAGSLWPRFPYAVIQHGLAGDYIMVLTRLIIAEVRRTIGESFPDGLIRFDEYLKAIEYEKAKSPTLEQIKAQPDLVRDAKDIHVALAAIHAKVDYLVTQDKDLTDPSAPIHQQVKILLPGTFLREHMGWTSEALEAIRKRNWADIAD